MKGFYEIVEVKYKGVWKIGVFQLIYRFILKKLQDAAIVAMLPTAYGALQICFMIMIMIMISYNRRLIETRMQFNEWCRFQWPSMAL